LPFAASLRLSNCPSDMSEFLTWVGTH
jgi:hypothetical protein